jgi:hypothetical protein
MPPEVPAIAVVGRGLQGHQAPNRANHNLPEWGCRRVVAAGRERTTGAQHPPGASSREARRYWRTGGVCVGPVGFGTQRRCRDAPQVAAEVPIDTRQRSQRL